MHFYPPQKKTSKVSKIQHVQRYLLMNDVMFNWLRFGFKRISTLNKNSVFFYCFMWGSKRIIYKKNVPFQYSTSNCHSSQHRSALVLNNEQNKKTSTKIAQKLKPVCFAEILWFLFNLTILKARWISHTAWKQWSSTYCRLHCRISRKWTLSSQNIFTGRARYSLSCLYSSCQPLKELKGSLVVKLMQTKLFIFCYANHVLLLLSLNHPL